jgi:hypothetical protein
MRKSRLAAAAVLVLVGVLWFAQGTGTLAGSAMSGQSMWAFIGGLLIAVGLALGGYEVVRKPAG